YPEEGESRININTADPLVLQALDPRISQAVASEIIHGRPYRTIQELDRVSSFEALGKELRLQNAYDVKTNIFSAKMTLTINEVVKHALVTLRRDPNTGTSSVLYFRLL
ncbi:MAG TPA: type II secretion system protein GspK, partial [Nitrospira sp.]|nr:type II secretion system protein GspK [Nitrospira sp.]